MLDRFYVSVVVKTLGYSEPLELNTDERGVEADDLRSKIPHDHSAREH